MTPEPDDDEVDRLERTLVDVDGQEVDRLERTFLEEPEVDRLERTILEEPEVDRLERTILEEPEERRPPPPARPPGKRLVDTLKAPPKRPRPKFESDLGELPDP